VVVKVGFDRWRCKVEDGVVLVWTGGVLQGAAEDVVGTDQSHFTATLGISTSSLFTFLDFLFFFLGIGGINHASRGC
jgi:hypothetical protein